MTARKNNVIASFQLCESEAISFSKAKIWDSMPVLGNRYNITATKKPRISPRLPSYIFKAYLLAWDIAAS
jgi:hypothetical protein